MESSQGKSPFNLIATRTKSGEPWKLDSKSYTEASTKIPSRCHFNHTIKRRNSISSERPKWDMVPLKTHEHKIIFNPHMLKPHRPVAHQQQTSSASEPGPMLLTFPHNRRLVRSSKQSRSGRLDFRMEIFAGFSIGPRSTPCPRPKDLMELAKRGFFQKSEANSSFAILSKAKKTWAIFDISVFEKQQLRNATLAGKRARKAGQTEKQPNRKHV
jgi:hypothetical protein